MRREWRGGGERRARGRDEARYVRAGVARKCGAITPHAFLNSDRPRGGPTPKPRGGGGGLGGEAAEGKGVGDAGWAACGWGAARRGESSGRGLGRRSGWVRGDALAGAAQRSGARERAANKCAPKKRGGCRARPKPGGGAQGMHAGAHAPRLSFRRWRCRAALRCVAPHNSSHPAPLLTDPAHALLLRCAWC